MSHLGVYRMTDDGIELVGRLSRENGSFAYCPEYLASTAPAPIWNSLPLRAEEYDGATARLYFEGLIPEEQARSAVAALLHVRSEDYTRLHQEAFAQVVAFAREIGLPPARFSKMCVGLVDQADAAIDSAAPPSTPATASAARRRGRAGWEGRTDRAGVGRVGQTVPEPGPPMARRRMGMGRTPCRSER